MFMIACAWCDFAFGNGYHRNFDGFFFRFFCIPYAGEFVHVVDRTLLARSTEVEFVVSWARNCPPRTDLSARHRCCWLALSQMSPVKERTFLFGVVGVVF